METFLSSTGEFSNFGKSLSFSMDHDSGYMSSESNTRVEDEKFVISEVIPNAENSENAVDGQTDLKNWEVVTTSFTNIVNKDDSTINTENSKLPQAQLSSVVPSVPLTPQKKFNNSVNPNLSPDLFADEETTESAPSDCTEASTTSKNVEKTYIDKKDHSLVRRATKSLKGVIPPHCMTIVHFSVDEMLNKIETNKEYFWDCEILHSQEVITKDSVEDFKSLLITGTKNIVNEKWPHVMHGRYHGLHHNRSQLSEEFEDLCAKYAQRYVGDETGSSCTIFQTSKTSPMKKKMIKQRWSIKSPGRRLSHLARRRITFSSANLQSNSSSLGRARQILVDAKKLDLLRKKSPKHSPRKTPSKSPRKKTRTPSSSAKKKLAARFRKLTGEIETTSSTTKNILSSKRALFQSPDRDSKSTLFLPSTSGIFLQETDQNKPTKRALFLSPSKNSHNRKSPFKRSPLKPLEIFSDRKRKRSESDDRNTKFPRSLSLDIRPSESELKVFNTTIGSESLCSQNYSQPVGELSAAHKKKLQWAVYEALRSQNIGPAHNQFKVFASNLARITRKLLPLNAPGKEVGTTERMLRITRHHVHAVIKGRSADEIVQEYLKNKAKIAKPHGYVGIEDFFTNVNSNRKVPFNILQDKVNVLESLEKKKLSETNKPKLENIQVERIRKAIDFGDDDNR